MGHIELAAPVSHIWFLRGIPSRIGLLLNLPVAELEKVIYFAAYVITGVNEGDKENLLKELDYLCGALVTQVAGQINVMVSLAWWHTPQRSLRAVLARVLAFCVARSVASFRR